MQSDLRDLVPAKDNAFAAFQRELQASVFGKPVQKSCESFYAFMTFKGSKQFDIDFFAGIADEILVLLQYAVKTRRGNFRRRLPYQ